MMKRGGDPSPEVGALVLAQEVTDHQGGLLYYDGDSELASLNPAIGAAALLLHYVPMASDQSKADSYVVSRPLRSRRQKLIFRLLRNGRLTT
jgi:hypothetical protein